MCPRFGVRVTAYREAKRVGFNEYCLATYGKPYWTTQANSEDDAVITPITFYTGPFAANGLLWPMRFLADRNDPNDSR